jgi:hypothetical protein
MANLSFGDSFHPQSERRATASLYLAVVRKPEIGHHL